jgi:hypothetical protein
MVYATSSKTTFDHHDDAGGLPNAFLNMAMNAVTDS